MVLLLRAGAVSAQEAPDSARNAMSRLHLGVGLLGADAAGDFSDHLDQAFGINVDLSYRLDARGILAIRADARWLNYGWDNATATVTSPFGGTDEADVTTTQNMFFFEVGPEVAVDLGVVRPYAGASIGAAQFQSQSSVRATSGNTHFTTNVQYDDFALAWGGQAGLRIPLSRGPRGISIDFRARYQRTGSADFLPEDGLTIDEEGFFDFTAVREAAEMWIVGAGVSIPLGRRTPASGDNAR